MQAEGHDTAVAAVAAPAAANSECAGVSEGALTAAEQAGQAVA